MTSAARLCFPTAAFAHYTNCERLLILLAAIFQLQLLIWPAVSVEQQEYVLCFILFYFFFATGRSPAAGEVIVMLLNKPIMVHIIEPYLLPFIIQITIVHT